jgi:polyisoprenoid-binding protein YceI
MRAFLLISLVGCHSASQDELAGENVDKADLGDEAPLGAEVWELDTEADPVLGFTAWGAFNSEQYGVWTTYNVRVTRDDAGEYDIDFLCEMDSVETGANALTKHLKTDDFFDVDNHPEGSFASTSVVDNDDDTWTVKGDMTLRGTTKTITFEATISEDGDSLASTATIEFSRWKFGIIADGASEAEADGVGDKVVVEYDVTLAKQ